jgi:two-component sensor histidine kinase/FixJ family two-component response regulator
MNCRGSSSDFTIEGANGRTYEGSGIGLALVQELVGQHGGSISVSSELGEGSVFAIRLPFGDAHLARERISDRAPGSQATAARAEAFVQEALRWLPEIGEAVETQVGLSTELANAAIAARGEGQKIILADDNADLRDYVRRLLTAEGYIVEAFPDGESALEAARRHKPHLILSDVMMPRLDGFGLLAELRRDEGLRELPIILLSARSGEEARVEGLDAGADDYVNKPFSARELLARIRTNLQLARIRGEAEDARREQAARLEAVLSTVPTAVWFTYDPEAKHIFGNAYGARLLRLSPEANVSLSAASDERPRYRVFGNGRELAARELPLQRAARGEEVRDEEIEIRFDDSSSITLIVQASPIRDGEGHFRGAVCAAADISDRKRQEQHRELLVNELNHRVKNTLTTVQSFAMQTLRNASSLADGRKRFDARLIALSKAHDVLVRENWDSAELREVIADSLAPYSGVAERRLRFDGPDIRIRPKAVLTLSMALHELATNAIKYGALSSHSGRIQISWTVGEDFQLCWKEMDGPEVTVPNRRGFGSRLIEQGLSREFRGQADLRFDACGVVCTIRAPLAEIRSMPSHAGEARQRA